MRKWINFELRQWRLRSIIRKENSIKLIQEGLGLEYDDLNLRYIRKIESEEIELWLTKNWMN